MDEWTDLDQAYLEIFGEHPDVDRHAIELCGGPTRDDE